MKKRVIDYISKGYKVQMHFSDGSKLIVANIVDDLESDNALEMNNGNNTTNHIINLNQVVYITPIQTTKGQKITF